MCPVSSYLPRSLLCASGSDRLIIRQVVGSSPTRPTNNQVSPLANAQRLSYHDLTPRNPTGTVEGRWLETMARPPLAMDTHGSITIKKRASAASKQSNGTARADS